MDGLEQAKRPATEAESSQTLDFSWSEPGSSNPKEFFGRMWKERNYQWQQAHFFENVGGGRNRIATEAQNIRNRPMVAIQANYYSPLACEGGGKDKKGKTAL